MILHKIKNIFYEKLTTYDVEYVYLFCHYIKSLFYATNKLTIDILYNVN